MSGLLGISDIHRISSRVYTSRPTTIGYTRRKERERGTCAECTTPSRPIESRLTRQQINGISRRAKAAEQEENFALPFKEKVEKKRFSSPGWWERKLRPGDNPHAGALQNGNENERSFWCLIRKKRRRRRRASERARSILC